MAKKTPWTPKDYDEALDWLWELKEKGCLLRWSEEAGRLEAYRPCGLLPSMAKHLSNLLYLESKEDWDRIRGLL